MIVFKQLLTSSKNPISNLRKIRFIGYLDMKTPKDSRLLGSEKNNSESLVHFDWIFETFVWSLSEIVRLPKRYTVEGSLHSFSINFKKLSAYLFWRSYKSYMRPLNKFLKVVPHESYIFLIPICRKVSKYSTRRWYTVIHYTFCQLHAKYAHRL